MTETRVSCGLRLSRGCKGLGKLYSCLLGKSVCGVCYDKYWEGKGVSKVAKPSPKKENLYYHPNG